MKTTILLSMLVFVLSAFSEELSTPQLKQRADTLDCVCSSSNNPLKKVNNFTVLLPEKSPEAELFVQELEKIGQVKRFSLSDATGINFEGMGTGARLTFLLTPLMVTGEAKSEISRITICLEMSVEVLKTTNRIDSYIWATNLFSTKEKRSESVRRAAQQFTAYYQEANPTSKPVFYVYL